MSIHRHHHIWIDLAVGSESDDSISGGQNGKCHQHDLLSSIGKGIETFREVIPKRSRAASIAPPLLVETAIIDHGQNTCHFVSPQKGFQQMINSKN